MARPSKYSPELRERAVRIVFDHVHEYRSQWATIRSVGLRRGSSADEIWAGFTDRVLEIAPSASTWQRRTCRWRAFSTEVATDSGEGAAL